MWLLQIPMILGDQAASPEFLNDLFFSFLKILFIVAGLLYVAFAIVVVRQIRVMRESLVTSIAGSLQLLGFVHLLMAVIILAFFILVL